MIESQVKQLSSQLKEMGYPHIICIASDSLEGGGYQAGFSDGAESCPALLAVANLAFSGSLLEADWLLSKAKKNAKKLNKVLTSKFGNDEEVNASIITLLNHIKEQCAASDIALSAMVCTGSNGKGKFGWLSAWNVTSVRVQPVVVDVVKYLKRAKQDLNYSHLGVLHA